MIVNFFEHGYTPVSDVWVQIHSDIVCDGGPTQIINIVQITVVESFWAEHSIPQQKLTRQVHLETNKNLYLHVIRIFYYYSFKHG